MLTVVLGAGLLVGALTMNRPTVTPHTSPDAAQAAHAKAPAASSTTSRTPAGSSAAEPSAGPSVIAPAQTDAIPAVPVPDAPAGTVVEPLQPVAHHVAPDTAPASTNQLLYTYPARQTAPFTMFGVSWSGSQTVSLRYQLLSGGTWSSWTSLELDVPSLENPSRVGTDSIYVGPAEGLAVEISGPTTAQLRDANVTFIDTRELGGTPAASTTPQPDAVESGGLTPTALSTNSFAWAPAPQITTRAQWGAKEEYWGVGVSNPASACVSNFARNDGVIVHHTAGSNDYTLADVPGILNGILYYHSVKLTWCDIGYNFLVDKFGNAYEGRRGSIENFPLGAHAKGGNWDTTGISLMGDTSKTTVSDAVLSKIAALAAWKLTWSGVDIDSTTTYQADWGQVRIPVISGHNQVGYTACPGTFLINNMDTIRQKAKAYIQHPSITLNVPDTLLRGKATTLSGTAPTFMAGRSVTIIERDPTGTDWRKPATVDANGNFSISSPAGFDSGTGTFRVEFTAPWKMGTIVSNPASVAYRPALFTGTITSGALITDFGATSTITGTIAPGLAGETVRVWGWDPSTNTTLLLGTTTSTTAGAWSLAYTWGYAAAT
ncbi:MAG: N-acetylmuramoyl-L-alanine amidase, partial [Propionibacteriaceae bacterium]